MVWRLRCPLSSNAMKQMRTNASWRRGLFAQRDLQRAANAKFKMGAKDTLATVQSLYEAKLLSYPRTDSTFITENEFAYLKDNLSGYLDILGHSIDKPNLTPAKIRPMMPKCRSITPSSRRKGAASGPDAKLNANQQKIYDLVLRRTFMMFEEDFI